MTERFNTENTRRLQAGIYLAETVCTDNLKSLATVFGAIESTETGTRVTIGP